MLYYCWGDCMNLGEKIKELRLKNDMTQDDLASRCYVTRNAVSKWENDKVNDNGKK